MEVSHLKKVTYLYKNFMLDDTGISKYVYNLKPSSNKYMPFSPPVSVLYTL